MEVIPRRNAAVVAGLSERTLDRLHVQGAGPKRIQLTGRRCGYERADLESWLRSRAFASQAAAVAAGVTGAVPPKAVSRAAQARAAKAKQQRKRKKKGGVRAAASAS
jgi:predicted DNA-binding transcriptional regulator AlpA